MSVGNLERARADFAHKVQRQMAIKSLALIDGLATIAREDCVGPGPWKIMRAEEMAKGYQQTPDANPRHLYDNVLVALDERRLLNNGEPSGLLLFLDGLALAPGEKFLHVGCGVGYYTAIAAHAVGARGSVVGVEIDPELAARAARNLRPYPNITVVADNGSLGAFGSFDAVFINAGCTQIQASWLDQLALNGRLHVPLTVALPTPGVGAGWMLLVTRREAEYSVRFTSPVAIFHCEGARTSNGDALLAKAFAKGSHESVCRLRLDGHTTSERCWLHTSEFCLESDPALKRVQREEVPIDPKVLDRYVGQYEVAPNVFLIVNRRGDELFVHAAGRPEVRVYPESERKFFYKVVDAQITFVTDGSGRATGLLFQQGGRDVAGKLVQ
jgi:protein-L-isoaspartate(D-aspartate) O-methyltransferase